MKQLSPKQAARIAGIGYLIIFVLAIFGNFFVFEVLYVPGDASTTTTNLSSHTDLWRAGTLSFLVVAMVDVVIAWALYHFFAKQNKALSQLALFFRVINAILLAAATGFLHQALSTSILGLEVETLLHVETFHTLWMIALFGFGVHLILLGGLLFRNSKLQSVLAVLLTLAGAAYMLDTAALFLLENYASFASTILVFVAVPGVIGELGFTIWILVQGFRK